MSDDGSWDNSDGYEDEFELEESVDQVPLSPDPPTTSTNILGFGSNNSNNDNDDDEEDDDYNEASYDDDYNDDFEEDLNTTPASLQPPEVVSSPRTRITGQGRTHHSNLQPLPLPALDAPRQYSEEQPPIPRSPVHALRDMAEGSTSAVNVPNWKGEQRGGSNDNDSNDNDFISQEEKDKVQKLRGMARRSVVSFNQFLSVQQASDSTAQNVPITRSSSGSSARLSTMTTVAEGEAEGEGSGHGTRKGQRQDGIEETAHDHQCFNRDLTQPQLESSSRSEYLSPSTSAAVAAMMKRSWQETASQKKSRSTVDHETDRVLAWLADVAQPRPMSYSAQDENQNLVNGWAINPTLQQAKSDDATKAPRNVSTRSAVPHTSSLVAALSDPPATPGTLEENVLEVIFSSLMDELTYPAKGKDGEEDAYKKEYERVDVEERSALESLRRQSGPTRVQGGARTHQHQRHPSTLTQPLASYRGGYSLPNDTEGRTKAENACELSYLNLVKRACIDHPGRSKDLATASGISVELARQVQKELIGVVCDMFTDPQIVATIKTATISRIFAGQPLNQGMIGSP